MLIRGFTGISRDVAPPPALAEGRGRVASLIGKWDEKSTRKHLAPKIAATRASTEASFARMREARGACKVKSFWRWAEPAAVHAELRRGGDLDLSVATDDKRPELLAFLRSEKVDVFAPVSLRGPVITRRGASSGCGGTACCGRLPACGRPR
ncbi:MAG: hypothetical protein U0441_31155 [Polyangiaceae bacterium]